MSSKNRIYSYPSCTTCKKALKWLVENQIDYELIDIASCPPGKEILIEAIRQLGERKKIFNTSGLSYRNLGAQVIKAMDDSEAIEALAADGKLVKRPLLITDKGQILVGFKSEVWRETLLQ